MRAALALSLLCVCAAACSSGERDSATEADTANATTTEVTTTEAQEPEPELDVATAEVWISEPGGDRTAAGWMRQHIVGGETVDEIGEWPFMAAVVRPRRRGLEQYCGGALVDARWVVSAAHCAVRRGHFVILGRSDLESRAGEVIRIRRVVPHPDYDPDTGAQFDHDVALLELERDAPSRFGRIRLSEEPEVAGQLTVLGWGALVEGGPMSTRLQRVTVSSVPLEDCRDRYDELYSVTANMMCAAAAGRDACQGDSGGPLVARRGGQHHLVGVVSFGEGCARQGYPGVYASMQRHLGFLRRYLRE